MAISDAQLVSDFSYVAVRTPPTLRYVTHVRLQIRPRGGVTRAGDSGLLLYTAAAQPATLPGKDGSLAGGDAEPPGAEAQLPGEEAPLPREDPGPSAGHAKLGRSGPPDFLSVSLRDGRVQLRFRLGRHPVTVVESDTAVDVKST